MYGFPSLSRVTFSYLLSVFVPLVFVIFSGGDSAARAEFVARGADWHSYINTESTRVKDTDFVSKLTVALDGATNYDDLVLTMGQCYGGGVIDAARGIPTSAYSSASQWDEKSYGSPPSTAALSTHNLYLDEWATAVDTAAKRSMLPAYTEARAQDPTGPVRMVYGADFVEHPQYVSSSPIGDAIKLRDSTPAKAILFGGSENTKRNYNDILRIHDILTTRYGYAEADIYAMYPGTTRPDPALPAFPAWLTHRAAAADLDAAFTWLDGFTSAASKPDVLYWNDGAHGTRTKDVKAAAAPSTNSIVFDLDTPFIGDYYSTDPLDIVNRFLSVSYSGLSGSSELFLNGSSLGFLPAGSQTFDIPLNPGLVPLLAAGDTLQLSGGSFFDVFTSIDLGLTATGNLVPEPGAISLLLLGSLALLRRRR
jgi:hypothetical protein